MSFFERGGRQERELKWAKVWFKHLCRFHNKDHDPMWAFTAEDVIVFLQNRRDQNCPAKKRHLIVVGLMRYRELVQHRSSDDLSPIRRKLREIAEWETAKERGFETIEDVVGKINPNEPDIIQDFRRALRRSGKAVATERAYVQKVRAFMKSRALRSRADFAGITGADVESHLTDLAVDGNVAASTQNQAFHGLLFLFEYVLKQDIGRITATRASKGKQIPTVLSTNETERIFSHLTGVYLTIAKLLYGCGMRISEALRLRVKDIDFDNRLIEIHQAKGEKSRLVPLPAELVEPLRRVIRSREVLHRHDVADGVASVWLPYALDRKYPNAESEWKWQFVFASDRLSCEPRTKKLHRHHLHRDTFPRHLRNAVEKAGVNKAVSSHVFRHSFATHLLHQGTNIRVIQELLGHSDLNTTMIYTHVMNEEDGKLVSPLDRLSGGDAGGSPSDELEDSEMESSEATQNEPESGRQDSTEVSSVSLTRSPSPKDAGEQEDGTEQQDRGTRDPSVGRLRRCVSVVQSVFSSRLGLRRRFRHRAATESDLSGG